MAFISYAQNFEDVMLWRALKEFGPGFYIDIGAWHPEVDSVTKAFYDRGWRGINVEPGAVGFARLAAARPDDINLNVAVGSRPGTATFFTLDAAVSGSSTLDPSIVAEAEARAWAVQTTTVAVESVADICERHAPSTIHFMKIDVEGHEHAVLEGADFTRFRPWILVIEATEPMSQVPSHAGWEPLLLSSGYRFVWFDGLNRFYLAAERHADLARFFDAPPNVFDGFIRASDAEWATRIGPGGTRPETQAMRATRAELRAGIAEDRALASQLRLVRLSIEAGARQDSDARAAALEALRTTDRLHHDALQQRLALAERARDDAEAWLGAVRNSTSWRLTRPIRHLGRLAGRGGRGDGRAPGVEPVPMAAVLPPPSTPKPPRRLHAVHQFHSGTAVGDAITNAMILTRRVLRGLGYDSRIFVEHRDAAYASDFHLLEDLPDHADFVLLVRHSLGYGAFDRVLASSAPKILIYHNITPADLLEETPGLREYARIGREQLIRLRPEVVAALADSPYNAFELTRAQFKPVFVCPLLVDLETIPVRDDADRPRAVFTVLFVGRVSHAKGQRDLLTAFAHFRTQYAGETRLVLVGRHGGSQDPYLLEMLAFTRAHGLNTGQVEITGQVSDAELARAYSEADLFVSASRHEGFGVPLIEAMAHGVPVLAVASGGVPYTVGSAAMLVGDTSPALLAGAMLTLANNPALRRDLVTNGRARLAAFGVRSHIPALVEALVLAGAERPADGLLREHVAAQVRFAIAGHVSGTYSLAEANRALALAIEAARPGIVRMIAVEGAPTEQVAAVPEQQRTLLDMLLMRPEPVTGPEVVISQHYPVWAPPRAMQVALALFYWEETIVPAATIAALNERFAGIIAPSRTVARALIDSGANVPVRVVAPVPSLDRFLALGRQKMLRDHAAPLTFLHVSSCFPRKGADVLLRAYARAFRAGDPVRLIIKGFPNPHNTISAQIDALYASDAGAPQIELIDRDISLDEHLALYRRADVMVLPARGEGYNLPAAEALAAGLRLIVTGWGGHMDFVGQAAPGAVRLVDYRFDWSGSHLATPFSLWAEPDEADLVCALREAVARRDIEPAPVAFSQPDVAGALATFAAELLVPSVPKPARVGWITTWDVRCGIAGYSRHLVDAVHLPSVIFADTRTMAGPDVLPSWVPGSPDSLGALTRAILRENPPAIVLQHQPGLFAWSTLVTLLDDPALSGRVVCVTLHNTINLGEAAPDTRNAAVRALGAVSRVAVHTLADVNRLSAMGLNANVVLIPQGATSPGVSVPVRTLSTADRVTIGCYGFFLPGKGILALIEAFAHLKLAWPNAQLKLVNAEYPAGVSLSEIAAAHLAITRLRLDGSIVLHTEYQTDAASTAMLQTCDLICLPYEQSKEASSAALRTALSTGVAVATTPATIFDEAGAAVLRLPGFTWKEIADGLEACLLDHAAREMAVGAAQAWTAARAWPEIGRRWEGMLGGLLASGLVR